MWGEKVECEERRWNVGREGGVCGEKVECEGRRWSVRREGGVCGEKVECVYIRVEYLLWHKLPEDARSTTSCTVY